MRKAYKVLSVAGDVKAVSRGPGAFARRQVRKQGHKLVGRLLRRLLKV